jgi:hypothetical protein
LNDAADVAPFLYARVDWAVTAEGPMLIELEITEPALFLQTPASGRSATPQQPVDRFAAAIATRATAQQSNRAG